ncbi:MAG: LamG domain-containing protein, partial [Candidatus Peregrinibacteria bacterium]|nr:LamG domain-containing protein [Candidatus Peregrinibacteria bacterium]
LMRGYGDGTFGPANAVTRSETVKIVYDSMLVVEDPMGPAEGTLEVILSNDTPRGTNVPYNATSVPFTTVELTASDDSDIEISSLTFTRLGLGDNDDFDNVWLEIDGFKVGNDKSINNDDVVELRFNPPIVVPAGQTIVADVVASAKYSATDKNVGHHNRLAVVSADDIASSAMNVVGDFPVEGEEMEVADYQVSELEFGSLGSDTTVDVGDNFIEIGKFRMLNQSTTNKDVEVRALTFKNSGTAELEDDLENVALYVSGEQVSAETIMDGDYVTFRLDNGVTGGYVIEDGDSRIFSIRADIVSAERDDTINFKVDNFEDIVGVEIGTSFGVKAVDSTGASAEDSAATLATYTIDSGDLNVSRDPSSLGNQQYAPGSNDVVVMTARLVVDQPLLTDGVDIYVSSGFVADKSADSNSDNDDLSDWNAAFDNFRLFLNDTLVDSENDFSAGTDGDVSTYFLNFNTTFEIAGTSILKVVANIQDGAESDDKVKLVLTATEFESVEYISTGDSVVTGELLGSASGSFVEVISSGLTIARTDGLSDGDVIVAGVDDVTFLQFILDNNDSGDVNVTSATILATGTDAAATYSNFTAAVFVDGVQQGSAKNLDATAGTATFNDLSVVIPSAGQTEFTIVLDTIEASSNGTGDADTLSIDIVDVDADNVENGQTVAVTEGGVALSTTNSLDGALFTLVQSGTLTVSLDSTVYSDILVANSTDVEILKVRLNAANDEVQIKDFYFENDVAGDGTADNLAAGDRVDFKLYNESGQLVQEKTMTAGTLHFELANQDRIRVPKDDSTFVTIKVDVRDLTKANQTGNRLALALDADNTTHYGVTAVTASTGDDIAAASWGDAVGEDFVIYRTQMSVDHAATQPSFAGPSTASQEMYRFTVTADAARQIELG